MPQTDIFLALSQSGFDIKSGSSLGSTDARCPGAIEVLGVKHEIVQIGSEGGGRPRSVEVVDHGEMRIRKAVDAGTPKLFKWCSIGEFISEARLLFFTACGGYGGSPSNITLPSPCLEYVMSYVHISSIELEADNENVPTEWIGLKYGQMKVVWNQGGTYRSSGGKVQESWSQVMEIPEAITAGGSTSDAKSSFTSGESPAWST